MLKRLCLIALVTILMSAGDDDFPESFFKNCHRVVLDDAMYRRKCLFQLEGSRILEVEAENIGKIIMNTGDTLKFVNHTTLTGMFQDAKRAGCAVFIYTNRNKLIGKYNVGGVDGLPSYIEDKELVFVNNDPPCNLTTRISFEDSIPEYIFVRCTEEGGDLWRFLR